jgi:hypothetical protein
MKINVSIKNIIFFMALVFLPVYLIIAYDFLFYIVLEFIDEKTLYSFDYIPILKSVHIFLTVLPVVICIFIILIHKEFFAKLSVCIVTAIIFISLLFCFLIGFIPFFFSLSFLSKTTIGEAYNYIIFAMVLYLCLTIYSLILNCKSKNSNNINQLK